MAIIAALISAATAVLTTFLAFYLNKTRWSSGRSAQTSDQHETIGLSVLPSIRLLFVVPIAFILALPAGCAAFGIAVVWNTFFPPNDAPETLQSLDAGLTAGAVFALSVILHAAFDEPQKWWTKLPWYPVAVAIFFGSLGYLFAFTGNSIWAWALGASLEEANVVGDSIDAGLTSIITACAAAYACAKIEELRRSAPAKAPSIGNAVSAG